MDHGAAPARPAPVAPAAARNNYPFDHYGQTGGNILDVLEVGFIVDAVWPASRVISGETT